MEDTACRRPCRDSVIFPFMVLSVRTAGLCIRVNALKRRVVSQEKQKTYCWHLNSLTRTDRIIIINTTYFNLMNELIAFYFISLWIKSQPVLLVWQNKKYILRPFELLEGMFYHFSHFTSKVIMFISISANLFSARFLNQRTGWWKHDR